MKNNELKNHVLAVLDRLGKSTAHEIADQIEGSPALIQVHKVLSQLKGCGMIDHPKVIDCD